MLYLWSLSPENAKRYPARLLYLLASGGNHLIRRMVRDAIERVSDPRQFIEQLVAHRRPLHHNRTPAAELLYCPGRRRNGEHDDRQQLFTT